MGPTNGVPQPRRFALIGAAGYIAPRHMQAIKNTGNILVAALDRSDSVGVLDRHFLDVDFFTEFERFDRHVEKLRRRGVEKRIEYVSICTPNYLHDAHVRFALRVGADAICEKPLVLNPWNLDALAEMERETHRRVYTVLQLRLHPAVIALRESVQGAPAGNRYSVELTYVTSRGNWYLDSWKGDKGKSGGIATNIGIHFFDLLLWIFGRPASLEVHCSEQRKMAGHLSLEKAEVRWFLSIDPADLPGVARREGKPTYRSISVDGREVEFSEGFTDLHTVVYQKTLSGQGFGIEDARPSIDLVYAIRNSPPIGGETPKAHPLLCSAR
jgi:UDP-N-acetyl-2-amino-2-deoxyglucuronate dehydrogenase